MVGKQFQNGTSEIWKKCSGSLFPWYANPRMGIPFRGWTPGAHINTCTPKGPKSSVLILRLKTMIFRWFRNSKQPPGMYKTPLKNSKFFTYQLVSRISSINRIPQMTLNQMKERSYKNAPGKLNIIGGIPHYTLWMFPKEMRFKVPMIQKRLKLYIQSKPSICWFQWNHPCTKLIGATLLSLFETCSFPTWVISWTTYQ